jgi:spore germination protein KA
VQTEVNESFVTTVVNLVNKLLGTVIEEGKKDGTNIFQNLQNQIDSAKSAVKSIEKTIDGFEGVMEVAQDLNKTLSKTDLSSVLGDTQNVVNNTQDAIKVAESSVDVVTSSVGDVLTSSSKKLENSANNLKKITQFKDAFSGVNSGNCILFVDTISTAFDIDVKGFKQRSVQSPNNEVIIKGSQEAFVENLRTNTSLLRRIINNENLIIENIDIGKISQTKVAVCYMNNIANPKLVNEVKYRLNNLELDSIFSSGQLEQLIEDTDYSGIPSLISSERPDKCAQFLMQGRVVILLNGTPYSITAPAVLIDFLSSPEDTNLKVSFANFLKLLRCIAYFITLLSPGIFIAITSFHQELLPTELLFSILASRENVPFPIIFELLLMELSFELIRESSLRVPGPVGSTLGIVGALILGDAAVSAHIVSPILIIVVAIAGLSSFAIPDFSFAFHLRIYRFLFIILGYIAGFLGIGLGLFVYISMLCSMKSFGVDFTSPFTPYLSLGPNSYFIKPTWKQEQRASYILPKKKEAQPKISKKWKYNN